MDRIDIHIEVPAVPFDEHIAVFTSRIRFIFRCCVSRQKTVEWLLGSVTTHFQQQLIADDSV